MSSNTGLLLGSQVNYVVHVSLDGLGAKYLQFYVTNAPAQFPWFNWLITNGASTFNARCDYDVSETVPNHITMFTGRPVAQPAGLTNTIHHGYPSNFPSPNAIIHLHGNTNVPYKASFFDVAHDFGRSTAFYASKTRLQICNQSYDATYGAPDVEGANNGPDKIDFASLPLHTDFPYIILQFLPLSIYQLPITYECIFVKSERSGCTIRHNFIRWLVFGICKSWPTAFPKIGFWGNVLMTAAKNGRAYFLLFLYTLFALYPLYILFTPTILSLNRVLPSTPP